jgi:SAM-dependent methyltransferase
VFWKSRQVRTALIADLADVKPEDRVLDVGCGAGAGVDEAARRRAAVIGVDHSLLMVLLGRYLSYRRSGRDIEFKWWKAKRVFRWRKAKELPVGGPGSHGGLGERKYSEVP